MLMGQSAVVLSWNILRHRTGGCLTCGIALLWYWPVLYPVHGMCRLLTSLLKTVWGRTRWVALLGCSLLWPLK